MIKVSGAEFSFFTNKEQKVIVKNFDFTSGINERLYLKGENGSGKTTLMKLLSGFLRFEKGTYMCDSKIVFVPTNLDNFLLPWYSVIQNLNFFKQRGNSINSVNHKSEYVDLLSPFLNNESNEFLNKKIYELSSGQKAILSYICSQQLDADIFFFDELFANTSMTISKKIIDSMERKNMNIIFTAHCEEVGKKLCTRNLQIENFQ